MRRKNWSRQSNASAWRTAPDSIPRHRGFFLFDLLDSIILRVSEPRLLKWQYYELNPLYHNTPPLSDGNSPSGEHYILFQLLNQFGFHPNTREQAMELAKELLVEGWRDA